MAKILHKIDESLLSIRAWERHRGIIAGMTTRHGGVSRTPFRSLNVGFHVGDQKEDVLINRRLVAKKLSVPLERWTVGSQPHGSSIYKVQNDDAGKGALAEHTAIQGIDGLYTEERGVLLVSLYADCVPIFFFEKQRQVVGIAHAGWKGSVDNIAGRMVEAWKKEGIDPSAIQAVIGPAIGSCCYEVNDDVIDEVNKLQFKRKVAHKQENGKYRLNLKLLNKQLLMQAGVAEEAIAVSQRCTSCESSTFYSHRKEKGQTGRMMAFIGMPPFALDETGEQKQN